LKAGNDRQVLPVLAELAQELAGAGQSRKALAILRRIEALAHRDIQELCLAPLERDRVPSLLENDPGPVQASEAEAPGGAPPAAEAPRRGPRRPVFQDRFQSWLHHVSREHEASDARVVDPSNPSGDPVLTSP
jgi:hypothetical protein